MNTIASKDNTNSRIAAVQSYFDFLGEPDRLRAAIAARKEMSQGDVRVLTVEVVLKGQKPVLPWPDKLVIEVEHPAWYKVSAINYGARHLLREGYEHIAWFDADSFVTPSRWAEAALTALEHHKIIQLGDTLTEYEDNVHPSVHTTIAAEICSGSTLEFRGADGGGWAARGDFFTSLGLWPYSMVEGGNKILLYPFMKERMDDHPLILATADTDLGNDLKDYWKRFETWNDETPLGVMKNHHLTLLPHGSEEGRGRVWAIRYAFYRHIARERDITMTQEGVPQVKTAKLRAFLELILRERSFPSPENSRR